MSNSKYMAQLDTLRAFAVASVAWYHWAPRHLHLGLPWYVGVNLFFVISGFLITGILLDCRWPEDRAENLQKGFSLRQFYIRRFLRIFPLYYLVLFLLFVADVKPVRETLFWHVFYGSNFYYLCHGWQGWISHFWSLSVEEQFYIFWPFLVLFVPRKMLFPLIAGLSLASPMYRIVIFMFFPSVHMSSILVLGNLDSLGMGAMLALVRHGKVPFGIGGMLVANRNRLLWVSLSGYMLVYLAGILGWKPIWIAAFEATVLALFFASTVHSVSNGRGGILGEILGFAPLRYLGRISYGLYIFHGLPPIVNGLPGVPSSVWQNLPLRFVLQGLATVAVASISWHLFESPINNLKRKFPYVRKSTDQTTAALPVGQLCSVRSSENVTR